jgi:hypothetical protein
MFAPRSEPSSSELITHLEETPIYYSGIGSRSTPPDVLALMTDLARALARAGLVLRSGWARRADQAFTSGAWDAYGRSEIYLPEDGFNGLWCSEAPEGCLVFPKPLTSAYRIAAGHHPAWDCCKPFVRSLHARNVHQVLGQNPDHPVLSCAVMCWTPDGSLDGRGPRCGGTGQALRVAAAYGVPVTNLARPDHREKAERWLAANLTRGES